MISGVCYKLALHLLTRLKKGIERKKKNACDGIVVAFYKQSRFSLLPSNVVQYPRAVTQFGFTKRPTFIYLRLPSIVTSFEGLIDIKFTPRR